MLHITKPHSQFILASKSRIRKEILTKAGYLFDAAPSNVDEVEILHHSRQALESPSSTANKLATRKALIISQKFPRQHVLAADQILTCENLWLRKPHNISAGREQLFHLSGKLHVLHTAVCIMSPSGQTWTHMERSHLTMRHLSAKFIDKYLSSIDSDALSSAGCYQLEGYGSQLFDVINGDFFAILGLPLIPTMRQLRAYEIVPL